MSVSSLGIVFETGVVAFRGIPSQQPDAGWRHLSLPVELCVRGDDLGGWHQFICEQSAPARQSNSAGEPAMLDGATEGHPVMEFRLRLFGVLDEGVDAVYCFFDTESKRWIRLSCGEQDSVSGIAVVASASGPLVVDTLNSVRYLIDLQQNHMNRIDRLEELNEDR